MSVTHVVSKYIEEQDKFSEANKNKIAKSLAYMISVELKKIKGLLLLSFTF